MSEQKEPFKTLIIGSGPAGYTAAIYAARADLQPVMVEGMQPGGQLMDTNDVENYPGYPEGVNGPQMMMDFRAQAARFETDIRSGFVTKVDFSGPVHKVWVNDEEELEAHSIIISTGAAAKWLGLENEIRIRDLGGGVSACAVCDGFFYRGQEVVVVGAGDTAAEEATYLAKLCKKVHMVVRRDEMRASKVMQHRVENTENIEIHWNTETVDVLGENTVEGVKVVNNQTKEESVIDVTGFFVAIGHKPNTKMFKGWLDMDATGYLIHKPDSSHSNVEGVFISGDAGDKVYRQAVTAAGTGCMAALDAERYLAAKGIH
ncbi:MAG: thioredoxin-disulfide reductase [Flavobacteriales bacterium]|jgi:thioredoxin reductase (NADPH)|nr:thioredoxin-disulfide reductase [Flavobacteriales bacterium]MBT3963505.1 thioredoxin-disulfide reductase [Flavobacteriales bacterium]MBT4705398.1 thioredoxin-disulfide reductase [Flavobacteriales bacterium]MBT4929851.1 thioredoxin-disulfide reductase [Flavobacteriales bacterium]MBT5132225.1 thioredoxin-disulfide reductase [Flavobacteriales bacterium]